MPSLQAKCSEELDEKLKAIMAISGVKRQRIISDAVEQYCDKELSKAAK